MTSLRFTEYRMNIFCWQFCKIWSRPLCPPQANTMECWADVGPATMGQRQSNIGPAPRVCCVTQIDLHTFERGLYGGCTLFPADTRRCSDVISMLRQRRRWWTNIKTTLLMGQSASQRARYAMFRYQFDVGPASQTVDRHLVKWCVCCDGPLFPAQSGRPLIKQVAQI